MPAVQTQFNQFHDEIKLDIDNEKAKLRQKRETLLKALKSTLPDSAPPFEGFSQGSYSMDTGMVPVDGNYDIDVGVIFDCSSTDYDDPVKLKKVVRDALNSNGRTVSIRRPCVTVDYMRNGIPEFHVDLAIYAKRSDGLLDLAKGKENSAEDKRFWEVSDPKGLTDKIVSAFDDSKDLAQYRRCIRYMKRWRDVQFASGAPLSITLTVAALNWFEPKKTPSGTYIDLEALLAWTEAMLQNFSYTHTEKDGAHERLQVMLPVEPRNDVMGWMTKAQMDNFKTKLESLRDALREAYYEALPEVACKVLGKQFGNEFPVPEKSSTGKAVAPAFIGTGSSA